MIRKNASGSSLARSSEGGNAHQSPWEEMTEFRRQIDELFSRTFGYTPLSRMIPTVMNIWKPSVEVYVTEDSVMLFAAVPGCSPGSIHVEATTDTVMLQGERKPLFENEKATPHRQTWLSPAGSFSVGYSLPCEIDPNRVKASCENGVFELTMTKPEQSRQKTVNTKVLG